jgi:hypothetical protein
MCVKLLAVFIVYASIAEGSKWSMAKQNANHRIIQRNSKKRKPYNAEIQEMVRILEVQKISVKDLVLKIRKTEEAIKETKEKTCYNRFAIFSEALGISSYTLYGSGIVFCATGLPGVLIIMGVGATACLAAIVLDGAKSISEKHENVPPDVKQKLLKLKKELDAYLLFEKEKLVPEEKNEFLEFRQKVEQPFLHFFFEGDWEQQAEMARLRNKANDHSGNQINEVNNNVFNPQQSVHQQHQLNEHHDNQAEYEGMQKQAETGNPMHEANDRRRNQKNETNNNKLNTQPQRVLELQNEENN